MASIYEGTSNATGLPEPNRRLRKQQEATSYTQTYDQPSRIAAVETGSQGTLPTHVTAYLAGVPGQKDLARLGALFARGWSVDPMYIFGTRDPSKYVSPITGKPLTMREAHRFSGAFAPVATTGMLRQTLEYTVPTRGHGGASITRTLEPGQVAPFARTLAVYSGDSLDLQQGMGLAVQMAKDGKSAKSFHDNMTWIQSWWDQTAPGTYNADRALKWGLQMTYANVHARSVDDVQEAIYPTAHISSQEIENAKANIRQGYGASPDTTVGLGPEFDIQFDVNGYIASQHDVQVRQSVLHADQARQQAEQQYGVGSKQAQKAYDDALTSDLPMAMSGDLGPDYWKQVEEEQARIEADNQAFMNSAFNKFVLEPIGYIGHMDQVVFKDLMGVAVQAVGHAGAGELGGLQKLGLTGTTPESATRLGLTPGSRDVAQFWESASKYQAQRLYNQSETPGSLIAEPLKGRDGFFGEHSAWIGHGLDFLIAWELDPLIIAGRARAAYLEKFLVPGTLDHGQLAKKVLYNVPGIGVKIQEADAAALVGKTQAWLDRVDRFASSKVSKNLFFSEDDTSLFRRVYRLRGKVEARSTLDVQYVKALRDRIITKFGPGYRDSAEALQEWEIGMKAHFTHYAPPDSVAAEVVNARDGMGFRARQEAAAFDGTVSAPGSTAEQIKTLETDIGILKAKPTELTSREVTKLRSMTTKLADLRDAPTTAHQAAMLDVVDNGGSIPGTVPIPGWLSQEIPGVTKLAEFGPRRLIRTAITSPALTERFTWSKHLAGLPVVNPGRVAPIGDSRAMIDYIYENNSGWKVFSETELRTQQADISHIYSSGGATESRVAAYIDSTNEKGFQAWIKPFNVDANVEAKLKETLLQPTTTLNQRGSKTVFGVLSKDADYARNPLMESQLRNQLYVVDPMTVRTGIRHYISMRDRLAQTYRRIVSGDTKTLGVETSERFGHARVVAALDRTGIVYEAWLRFWKSMVVARPAYFTRVVIGDENLRFLATTSSVGDRALALGWGHRAAGTDANVIKRFLDEHFGTQIKIGEDTITVPRAGATEYNAAAAGNLRESDLVAEMVKGRNTAYKTYGSDGSFNIIKASEANLGTTTKNGINLVSSADHASAWSWDLAMQGRSSEAGAVALKSIENGDTIATTATKLQDWARNDRYITLESRIGRSRAEVEPWSQDLSQVMHAYTMDNKEIAAMAQLGDRKGLIGFIEKNVPIEERPLVHSPTLSELAGDGGVKAITNKAYSIFVQRGEDAWNRQPFYSEMKRRSQEAMLKTTGILGGKATPEVLARIDRASTEFGLGQVRRVMFDFTRQSRFSEMLQIAFPFPQPFFEGFQAWGHIAYRNPTAIIHGKQLFEYGVNSGFFQKDPNSGEYMVPASYMYWGMLAGASLFGSDNTYRTFKALDTPWMPLANMNMLTASTLKFGAGGFVGKVIGGVPIPAPSLNPLIQMSAGWVFGKLGWDKSPVWQGYAMQYGTSGTQLPGTISRLTQIFLPNKWRDSNTFKSLTLTVTEAMRRNGWDVDENGNRIPLNEEERQRMQAAITNGANITIGGNGQTLTEIAQSQAENLMQWKAGFDLFNPTAARLQFQGQREDYANFKSMLDSHQDDFQGAVDEWYAKYPDKWMIPIGRTLAGQGYEGPNTGVRVPASELTFQMYRMEGIGDAMQHNPALAALLLVGTDPAIQEQQDFKAFSDILSRGLARYKLPDEYWASATEAAGWRAYDVWLRTQYYPRKDAITQAHGSESSAEQSDKYLKLKQDRAQFLDYMYTQNPSWVLSNAQFNPQTQQWHLVNAFGDDRRSIDAARGDVRQITQLPGLENFPGIQAMTYYMDQTDALKQKMNDKWVTDINSEKSREKGLWDQYNKIVQDTVEMAPDVAPFLQKYFGVHMNDPATAPAAVLSPGDPTKAQTQVFSTDDLVYGISEREWAFSEVVPSLTAKYVAKGMLPVDAEAKALQVQANVIHLDERMSKLKHNAVDQPFDSVERQQAYGKVDALVNATWRDSPQVMKAWWKAMGPSQQQDYKEYLAVKPVDFYTAFDYDRAGVKLSPYAQEVFQNVSNMRLQIAKNSQEAVATGNTTYTAGAGYDQIDAYVRESLKKAPKDKGLRKALEASNVWGWGIDNVLGYGKPVGENKKGDPLYKGKADQLWAWYLGAIRSAQASLDAGDYGGINYGTADQKKVYYSVQKWGRDLAQHYISENDAFKQQWSDLQKLNGGDPIVGTLILPDDYFGPLGG